MTDFDDDDDFTFAPRKPFWRCEACGHESHTKPMPGNRAAFYAKVARLQTSPKCPKCGSEAFMPVGF